jgi:hypothetical protein
MKKAIVLSILVYLCGQSSALTVFNTDGQILDGETHDYAKVYGSSTLDMLGGVVTEVLSAKDSSVINISGGSVNHLENSYTHNGAINISGDVAIQSTVINGSATTYINGGNLNTVEVYSDGGTGFYSGTVNGYLLASSQVNIYGYGFNYDPFGGSNDGGQLTGFWMDDSAFSIDLKNYGGGDFPVGVTYDNLNLVPEPATLALFGLGSILIRCRKKTNSCL